MTVCFIDVLIILKMLKCYKMTLIVWSIGLVNQWSMEFNVTKCEVIHLTKKRNVIFNSYFMNGTKLSTTNSEKYLDARISNSLSWKSHIDVVRKECFQKLGIIKHVFSKCNKNIEVKLYKQLVRPKLDYCVNVWKPATPGLQKLIEKVQKRAAGLVLGHPVEDYTRDISVFILVTYSYKANISGTLFNV